MTKKEVAAIIDAVPLEETPFFLRNALKTGLLTEDEISEYFGLPFNELGLAENHYDDFRV